MAESLPLLSIVMPAYNAGNTIENTIERIPAAAWKQIKTVWIIDDGSTDSTGKIIDSLSQTISKVRPVHLAHNGGYGAAMCDGLLRCREEGAGMVCSLHADGQYPPEAIEQFSLQMAGRQYDILQGSRIASGTALSGGMPLYKFAAGKILTFFENLVFKMAMTDFHSGYLFYSRRALLAIPFERLSRSFDFDLEVIASARSRGFAIGELPIPTRYADERSYLNPVAYGFRVLGVLVKYCVGKYRP